MHNNIVPGTLKVKLIETIDILQVCTADMESWSPQGEFECYHELSVQGVHKATRQGCPVHLGSVRRRCRQRTSVSINDWSATLNTTTNSQLFRN